MGDYLTNLLNRTEGKEIILRPRPRARFEGATIENGWGSLESDPVVETQSGNWRKQTPREIQMPLNLSELSGNPMENKGTGVERSPESVGLRTESEVRQLEPSPEIQSTRRSVRSIPLEATVPPTVKPMEQRKPLVKTSSLRPAQLSPQVTSLPPQDVPSASSKGFVEKKLPVSTKRIPVANQRVLTPKIAPLENRQVQEMGARSESASNDPAIHITIGRLEVKAVPPPPSPVRRKPKRHSSIMSLDEYLRRRANEKRT